MTSGSSSCGRVFIRGKPVRQKIQTTRVYDNSKCSCSGCTELMSSASGVLASTRPVYLCGGASKRKSCHSVGRYLTQENLFQSPTSGCHIASLWL